MFSIRPSVLTRAGVSGCWKRQLTRSRARLGRWMAAVSGGGKLYQLPSIGLFFVIYLDNVLVIEGMNSFPNDSGGKQFVAGWGLNTLSM